MRYHFKILNIFVTVVLLVITGSGCIENQNNNLYTAELDSISRKWVPDAREGICGVSSRIEDGKLIIKGVTNLPEAKKDILGFLESNKVPFIDSLALIPDRDKIKEPWGLINVSVCNIRSNPDHDMELISQALMGTPVKILEHSEGWYRIQTPDSYIGWTDGDALVTLSDVKYSEWKRSDRIIWLGKTGDIAESPAGRDVVSDIVAGVILRSEGKEKGYLRVTLPDGRTGYLPEIDCRDLSAWASETKPEPDKILKTAKSLMGTPYLWGGTSVKGLDCSGFVKTVYFLNGLVLSRDASLQVMHGMEISDFRKPDNLQPGDLLFFDWNKRPVLRPTHVGMYIGNSEFIHESGMVRINSLDSTRKNFSRFRRDSFVAARRIIGINGPGLQSISGHPWYF